MQPTLSTGTAGAVARPKDADVYLLSDRHGRWNVHGRLFIDLQVTIPGVILHVCMGKGLASVCVCVC